MNALHDFHVIKSPVFLLARFLQQQVSSDNQISVDCHFFNTYFYKKLNDAVSYKVILSILIILIKCINDFGFKV